MIRLFFGFLGFFLFSPPGLRAEEAPKLLVYIFLAETCPICQSISPELNKLSNQYQKYGITFLGIFPNEVLSNEETRRAYGQKYSLSFPLSGDSSFNLTHKFNAEITPEVVVWDVNKQMIFSYV
jgi:peroxiredoxin